MSTSDEQVPTVGASKPSDSSEALLALAKRGDHEALRLLTERFERRWRRTIAKVVRDQSVLDVLQEAFVKAVSKMDLFNGGTVGEWFNWFHMIVWHTSLDHQKGYLRRFDDGPRPPDSDGPNWQPPDQLGETPSKCAVYRELSRTVDAILEELDAVDRKIIEMRMSGSSHAEIGGELDMNAATVRKRFSRSIQMLRERLISHGAHTG